MQLCVVQGKAATGGASSALESRTCKSCNKEFTMTQEEADFFTRKGFDLATVVRCKPCRDIKRQQHQNKGGEESCP